MFAYGKVLTVTLGVAALSGTTLVPTSNVFASPAPTAAAASAILLTQEFPQPPAAQPAEAPKPAVEAQAAPQEAAPQRAAEPKIAKRELACMTKVILYEAGAESRAGQLAVAQVVMNRARSGRFPKTVCGVIYQPGQFSSIRSYKTPGGARYKRAEALARAVMGGQEKSNVGSALFFHATRVRPAYVRSRTRVATIGNHVFYR